MKSFLYTLSYVDLRLSGTTCSEPSTNIRHDLHNEFSQFLSSSFKLYFAYYVSLFMKSLQLTILQSINQGIRMLVTTKQV